MNQRVSGLVRAELCRNVTTYLGLESPEKRCGETTLVTVLAELVNRPEVAANISSSAFFRTIEENQPTLLIDEADILLVFSMKGVDRVFSRDLVEHQGYREDRPWNDLLKGKPLSEWWLARQLRPYGVPPRPIWIGDACAKGYLTSDFRETFPRYIPASEVEDLRGRVERTEKLKR